MHWSTRRALDTIAREGHKRLDAELLDVLARDMRASKACSDPDCPNLQPCPVHGRKPWERKQARSTLSGSRQQKRARYIIERDQGICHVCGYAGADQADHVTPTTQGGADDVSNMKAIHEKPCHRDKTLAEAARARARSSST